MDEAPPPWMATPPICKPQVAGSSPAVGSDMDATDIDNPPPLRASLLGPVRLAVGDRPLSDDAWPRRSARSLLLLLLATPGRSLPRDRVLDLLWPEAAPDAALNALYVALHGLRRTLEPGLRVGKSSAYVESAAEAIRLRPVSGLWLDTDAFESALARADAAVADGRLALLREALALYAGDLLAEEPYADWPVARREALRRAWRRAVIDSADLARETGQPLTAAPDLERLLAADPTDEPAHRALMRALAAAGRRDEALRHYERCAAALRRELGTDPDDETAALAEAIAGAPAVPALNPLGLRPRPVRFNNLPTPPNPLVGRDRELAALQDLLWDPTARLVTVTGAGGIGKTRLALEAAARVADDFPDGACFVALAAIRDPSVVLPTIARALGVEETGGRPFAELLRDALRERELLLVLDNVEQVLDAAADLADLLTACPRLTLLVTSREPLRLRAEHELPTLPLTVPPTRPGGTDRTSAATVTRYDAVALFAQRARAANPAFAVTDGNAPAVAAVCARLDGLPLALELAAARCRHLSPEALLVGLTDRLGLLAAAYRDLPERHRTMRDAIAWSYDLLTPAEQALFRRLAVFAGGFTVEAAAAVIEGRTIDDPRPGEHEAPSAARWCAPGPRDSLLTRLEALVEKHLLRWQAGEPAPRLTMLETIRDYGLERLAANGELDPTQRAHAAHFLSLAEQAEPELTRPDQAAWLDRLEIEHDNLRAVLTWACRRPDPEIAVRLTGALPEFWRVRGHLAEGRAWLERALSLADRTPAGLQARALHGAGALARAQGDIAEAIARLTAAQDAWRAAGDQGALGRTLGVLATTVAGQGEYERAIALDEQALAIFESIADQRGTADTLNRLGIVASDRGQHARATELYERSLALFRTVDDRQGAGKVLNNLGGVAFWQEDYPRAVTLFDESLAIWRAAGDRPHTAIVLANLGEALRAEGDHDRAVAIAREGLQLSRDVGDKRSTATALFIMGSLQQLHSIDPRAADPLLEGLLLFQHVGDKRGMAWCLEALAGPATASGRPDLAARLLGAAEALREEVRVPIQPAERPAYERHLNAARSALSHADFDAARAIGRRRPLAETVSDALGMTHAIGTGTA